MNKTHTHEDISQACSNLYIANHNRTENLNQNRKTNFKLKFPKVDHKVELIRAKRNRELPKVIEILVNLNGHSQKVHPLTEKRQDILLSSNYKEKDWSRKTQSKIIINHISKDQEEEDNSFKLNNPTQYNYLMSKQFNGERIRNNSAENNIWIEANKEKHFQLNKQKRNNILQLKRISKHKINKFITEKRIDLRERKLKEKELFEGQFTNNSEVNKIIEAHHQNRLLQLKTKIAKEEDKSLGEYQNQLALHIYLINNLKNQNFKPETESN